MPKSKKKLEELWWRGPWVKGWALPYPLGYALQKIWLRLPINRAGLRRRATGLYEWLRIMGIEERSAAGRALIERSMLVNSWSDWRLHVISQWLESGRSFDVHGEEHLRAALDTGRGILLVGNHLGLLPFGLLAQKLLARHGVIAAGDTFGLVWGNAGDESTWYRRWPRLVEALRNGGAVLCLGDGVGSTIQSQGLPFPLFVGPSSLSLESGAVMIPITVELISGPRLKLVLHTPICPEEFRFATRAEQIDAMARCYGEFMLENCNVILGMLAWNTMARMLHIARGGQA